MKKITMLFVLSVFFFIGGMTNSFAQKITNESELQVTLSPLAKLANLGETVKMEFSVGGNVLTGKVYPISLFFKRPDQAPILLILMDYDGRIIYRNPEATKITIYYNAMTKKGTVTISNVTLENEGYYYVAVENEAVWYFSNASWLEVRRPD